MTTPKFSATGKTAKDAVISRDLNGIVLDWNDAAENLFGYSAQEAIGKPISIITPPEKISEETDIVFQIKGGAKIRACETVRLRKSGKPIPVSLMIAPVKDQQNIIKSFSITARPISNYNLSNSELDEREKQYQVFFDSAEFGFCICEILYDEKGVPRDYRYLEGNLMFKNITGISDLDILHKKTFLELFPNADISRVEIYDRVLKTEASAKFETFLKGLDKWVEIFAFPVNISHKNQVAILFHDVTRRKNVEEELRRNEEMLKTAQKISHIGSWEYQYRSQTTIWSDEMFRIYGLEESGEPPSWENLQNFIALDDIAKINQTVDLINATGTPHEVEFTIKSAKGTEKIALLTGETELDKDGQVVRLYGTLQDITERKRAERVVLKSEQRLRELIDNLFSFVILMDTEGHLVEANRTALDVARLEPEDVIGKHFADTYWWNWSEDIQENLRRAISHAVQGETIRYDVVIRLGENDFTTIDLQIAPMFDEYGKVINIVSSAIDISKRLDLEAKLMQTAQISLAGELAAGLAHEIKNPLTGMQGAIDLLLQRTSNEEEMECLKNIRHEIVRIDNIVHSLLDRTRPRMMCFSVASLSETVRHAVQIANHHLAARKLKDRIKISLNLPDEPPLITHDKAQVEDAVLNLIINGVESIQAEGTISVTLSRAQSDYNSEAVIKISDTGCGIKEENLRNLFTPFYTTKEIGTGLGLTSVKRVVDAHGGFCHVSSKVGKGTTFYIHLPEY